MCVGGRVEVKCKGVDPAVGAGAPPLAQCRRPFLHTALHCRGFCTNRLFEANNLTRNFDGVYDLEFGFHEMLLQSPHRTLDPDVRRGWGLGGNL